ncbi:universal stress protein [Kurthia senegalensis]|uniref:universal stress protein n=1 Tax=Kurthia senegalensis TaxID=1033740 RepID=UPI0002899522|nr:universal stress protein [Kurthia senegalensis]
MSTYNNIVVAVDGSEEAKFAFEKAVEVAKRNEAKLHLVNIIDTRSFAAIEAYDRSIQERAKEFAEEKLAEYKAAAEKEGVVAESLIEYGSPKTMITREVSKKTEADLIVCGATGLNAVERFLIGSVSANIVRSAKCDVLVVRTPGEHAE